MANSKLIVSDLDFNDIKSNLKRFLQSQSQFQDYDFEGSGLAILIDILSYNTHYMAYLANMSTNELYLDSADIRNNIVFERKWTKGRWYWLASSFKRCRGFGNG